METSTEGFPISPLTSASSERMSQARDTSQVPRWGQQGRTELRDWGTMGQGQVLLAGPSVTGRAQHRRPGEQQETPSGGVAGQTGPIPWQRVKVIET